MKTIIHLELSDEERSDLAKLLDRNPCTNRLVTRKEVTELTQTLVNDVLKRGLREDNGQTTEVNSEPEGPSDGDSGQRGDGGGGSSVSDDPDTRFIPSRGDEGYLAKPSDPGVAAACSRILDDAALIEQFAWDTIERNRKR